MEQEKQISKRSFSSCLGLMIFKKPPPKSAKKEADLGPPESHVGRPVAQLPPSASDDVKVNVDLGGTTEPTTRGTGGVLTTWWRLKVSPIIKKLHRGKTTVKEEEQPQVTADRPVSLPDCVLIAVANDQLAVEDSSDVESSVNSERIQYSFRSLDDLTVPTTTIARRVGDQLRRRLSRKVKYPEAVDELLFHRLDLWTYVAPVAGMMTVVVSYHIYGLISNEWKVDLVLFLLGSMASQKLGKTLKYKLPELAVVLMVGADGLLTAPFVIITFNLLPKDDLLCWKHFMLYVIILVFSANYCVCLYHIYKEDVREQPTMPTTDIDVSRLSTSFAV